MRQFNARGCIKKFCAQAKPSKINQEVACFVQRAALGWHCSFEDVKTNYKFTGEGWAMSPFSLCWLASDF